MSITKFHEITKIPKFRTNNVLFGYFFLLKFQKLLSYLKSANLSNCKIWLKTKMPKFETKNALFGYFDENAFFGFFLGCNLKIILSYLISAHYNFSICKILRTMKKSELGTKNVFLGTFLDWNLK